VQAYLSEFIGTMILILLGDGVVAAVLLRNSKAEHSGWIVITFGWGMAVAIAVYVAAISGAHINPAVTVGLASIGAFPWAQVPGYIIAQLLGAFVGAVLVWITYYDHWKETDDPVLKLGVFSTIPQIRNTVPNFITEVIGTAMLLFGVLAIVTNADGALVPLSVGFLVLAIGLSLGGPTGYAITHRPRRTADSGQGRFGFLLRLDTGRSTPSWRDHRSRSVEHPRAWSLTDLWAAVW
jgi:glycerol uptake facilitator protein